MIKAERNRSWMKMDRGSSLKVRVRRYIDPGAKEKCHKPVGGKTVIPGNWARGSLAQGRRSTRCRAGRSSLKFGETPIGFLGERYANFSTAGGEEGAGGRICGK